MFKGTHQQEEENGVAVVRYTTNPTYGDGDAQVTVFTTPSENNEATLGAANQDEADDGAESDSGKPAPNSRIVIQRKALNQGEIEHEYLWQPRKSKSFKESWKETRANCTCSMRCLGQTIVGLLPFIATIKNYQPKTDFVPDLVAGITIGIMQIPQGQ